MNHHRPLLAIVAALLVVEACLTYVGISMYATHRRARQRAIQEAVLARAVMADWPVPQIVMYTPRVDSSSRR
jgi:hypothetical protein